MLPNQFIVHTQDQDCGSPLSNKERLMVSVECFKISEAAIAAPAAHKNASEGSLAVCSSIARATGPSLRSLELVIQ
jgi:hypothetical protein